MKTLMKKYVEGLSDAEKALIIQNYERYEQDGFIGDEPIRAHARAYMEETSIDNSVGIVLSMERLAFECYRYFAKKHLGII